MASILLNEDDGSFSCDIHSIIHASRSAIDTFHSDLVGLHIILPTLLALSIRQPDDHSLRKTNTE